MFLNASLEFSMQGSNDSSDNDSADLIALAVALNAYEYLLYKPAVSPLRSYISAMGNLCFYVK